MTEAIVGDMIPKLPVKRFPRRQDVLFRDQAEEAPLNDKPIMPSTHAKDR